MSIIVSWIQRKEVEGRSLHRSDAECFKQADSSIKYKIIMRRSSWSVLEKEKGIWVTADSGYIISATGAVGF